MSRPRIVALCLLCIATLIVRAPGQVARTPKAESRMMRLDQSGMGVWAQAGHAEQQVVHVSLGGNPAQELGIEFTLADGGKRALAATLEHKGSYALQLQITNSSDADVNGALLIEYGPKNSINTLFASGRLDGKPFAVQFSGHLPLATNLTAAGMGSWARLNARAISIQRVSYFQDHTMQGEFAFFLVDGSVRRLTGQAKHKRGDHSLQVHISRSGMADAGGTVTIWLRPKNQVASVEGEINIDGQPVRLDFQAEGIDTIGAARAPGPRPAFPGLAVDEESGDARLNQLSC